MGTAVLIFAACTSPSRGPLSVIVHGAQDGTPQAGVAVLSHRADGSLLARTATAADGTAAIDVEDDGSVTISNGVLSTIADVAPGDTLVFGQTSAHSIGVMNVLLPSSAQPADYDVTGPGFIDDLVGRTAPMVPAAMFDSPATGDLLAIAGGATENQLLIAHDQPLVPGTTLDLTGFAWTVPPAVSCTVSGLPAGADQANLTRVPTQSGIPFDAGSGELSTTLAGGAATFACGFTGVGDGAVSTVTIWRPRSDGLAEDQQSISASGLSTSLDVSAAILPRWTGPIGFDGRTFIWSTDGSGTAPPIAVRLQANLAIGSWSVVAAGDRTSFTLPELPADLTPTVDATHAFGTLIGSQAEGYAAYRGHAFVVHGYFYSVGDPDPSAPFERLEAPRAPSE